MSFDKLNTIVNEINHNEKVYTEEKSLDIEDLINSFENMDEEELEKTINKLDEEMINKLKESGII